jgi:hypothetical protein
MCERTSLSSTLFERTGLIMKKVLALLLSLTFLAGAAFASPQKRKRRHARAQASAALTEVRVCPWNEEEVIGEGQGNETVGKYKVYFCCEEHKDEFDRLPAEEKQKKIAAALRKQKEKKKG